MDFREHVEGQGQQDDDVVADALATFSVKA
jgi:hypothetical protein